MQNCIMQHSCIIHKTNKRLNLKYQIIEYHRECGLLMGPNLKFILEHLLWSYEYALVMAYIYYLIRPWTKSLKAWDFNQQEAQATWPHSACHTWVLGIKCTLELVDKGLDLIDSGVPFLPLLKSFHHHFGEVASSLLCLLSTPLLGERL